MARRKTKKRSERLKVKLWYTFGFLMIAEIIFNLVLIHRQLEDVWSRDPVPDSSVQITPTPAATPVPTPTPIITALPAEAHVSVPFLVQAPFAVWDALHEDACEETSLIMVHHFLNGTPIGSKDAGDKEIKDLVAYGEAQGNGLSITLTQLQSLAQSYYGLTNGRVEKNITINDLKTELAAGRPVIIPAAGKLLHNPHFSSGGPNYHMLVLIGYDADGFITNDPGIREGEGYRYDYDTFYNAIHDYDATDITNGQKAYLVFDK